MNSMLSNAEDLGTPRAPYTRDGEHVRRVVLAVATMDDGTPIRFRRFCRNCRAVVFVGYHDFDGYDWRPRLFAGPDAELPALKGCPACGEHRRPMTELEAELACIKARDRSSAGEPLDAEMVACMGAELELGTETFDHVAALYGRDREQLQSELATWLEAKAESP